MPPFFRKMDTRRLHSAEIKQLVRVMRSDPSSTLAPVKAHDEKATMNTIKLLPRRLRSKLLSSHGSLCHSHKGLDTHLIDDIWAWIKFELEVAIGRFLYPLIVSGALSKSDEYRLRQLEPVMEMFLPEWTLAESSPPGKAPINTGMKWAYQKDGCPACMLSRLGSDSDVLFTLLAGMSGHLRPRNSSGKSKRMRFVRYWMRTHTNGEQKAEEAYDFGIELKALRREAKKSLRQSGQSSRFKRDVNNEAPESPRHFLGKDSDFVVDVSDPFNPKDWTVAWTHTPKISPTPQPRPKTPTVVEECKVFTRIDEHHVEFPQESIKIEPPAPKPIKVVPSRHSSHTIEEDTLPPLPKTLLARSNAKRVNRAASKYMDTLTLNRRDSIISAAPSATSVYSRATFATSIASYNKPSKSPTRTAAFDPLQTAAERMDKYRTLAFRGMLVPKPSRVSMYSAFGEDKRKGEEFEVVDMTPPPSPLEGFFQVQLPYLLDRKLGLYLCDPDFNDELIDWLVIEMRETGPFYSEVLLDLMSDLPRKTSEHRQLAIDTYLMELHNRWQPMIGTDWLPNFEKCDSDMFRKIMVAEQDVILKRYAGRDYIISHEYLFTQNGPITSKVLQKSTSLISPSVSSELTRKYLAPNPIVVYQQRKSTMRPFVAATLFIASAQGATSRSCIDFSPAPVPESQLPAYFPRQKLNNAASLIDVEDIRQTLSEYAFIIDGRAFDFLSDIFTANATADYSAPLGALTGVEKIKATLSTSLAQFSGTQHILGSQRIRLCSKTTAISATYFRAAHFFNATVGATALVDDSALLVAYAQYQDSWVKQDGLWKINYRNVVYMGPLITDAD
ncbi:hypothetical protein E8E13_003482 [Curvularia kusanoi]|uniref:SnoaL-like domain-containing protein n=1 Tax=Curvularia kusanoi TaxID=90978 RepID=A0A9P4W6C5_CURKU|nr:hypothetical protein E8E13_003482 [Curvularia kusanoi]